MKKSVLYSAVLSCAVLSACGGGSGGSGSGSGSSSGGTGTPSQTAPGGIYLGYYAEDPKTNPEDPTLGAFVLNMPSSNTSFSGAMFFTYVGCQSENVGVVSGNKTDAGIAGNWSGSLDGVMNTGSYTGSWQTATQSYSGTFTNAGGKQFRDLRPCIQYYIAPNGSFEMFAAEKLIPDTFQISLSGRTLSWSNVNGSTIALVYVMNPQIVQTAGNPVIWQAIVPASGSITIPQTVNLKAGTDYLVGVALTSDSLQRLAFGSKRFTAQ
ncbi:hypothetical protein [Undibacterium luofuense]|uniref:Lipoprotein n=1 Tax=Undibacterium luofuense TaxID=2828733 RepID=A0A941DN02_9BURK|nr:hypothetical protein [Undibacterium luofuense]MBR7783798.1 hypothetical protein [Undibacterium luofuense]